MVRRIFRKKLLLACSCMAVASLACGAMAYQESSASTPDPLTIRSGASIRLSTDGNSNGLRFTADVSSEFYADKIAEGSYKNDGETFGMLIAAASYFDDYEAYKATSAGADVDYYEYFSDVKQKMIDLKFNAEYLNEEEGEYFYYGTVANVNFNNSAMQYQSVAYYKAADGSYTYSAPSDKVSHAYVASAALNDGAFATNEQMKTLLTGYVERAMYVASGVRYDYEKETYTLGAEENEDYTALVELTPTMTISGSKTTLSLNETLNLTATAAPFADVAVEWSVSEGDAVTVSETGVVTAAKAGKATVTASYMNGKYFDSYELTVQKPTTALAKTKDVETKVDNSIAFTGIDGAVTDLKLGTTTLTGWTYNDETDTLSLPKTSLASLTNADLGPDKTLTLETATAIYTQKVWVVNKVISAYSHLRYLYRDYADIDETTNAVSGYYVLGADISMEQRDWCYWGNLGQGAALHYNMTSLKTASQDTLDAWAGFVGTFDGRGYAIQNMPAVQGGLFYKIGVGGAVKNVIFKMVNLRTGEYRADVATIAKSNYGTIDRVMVSIGAMARQCYSSALVTKNYGTISNIYVRANKSGDWSDHFYAVGANQEGGAVTNVVVSGNIAIKEGTSISGITKTDGDGWSTVNGQWYPRFGSAANGYCSTDGTSGRDGVFVIISDAVQAMDDYNASAVNNYS